MEEKKKFISIYTDGACRGNPGPGGWGVLIILDNNIKKELFGFEELTTNNRMELKAAIKALNYFNENKEIVLFTDSNYLKQGITTWIKAWKNNNWKTAQKKKIKNIDLWIELDEINNFHTVDWKWVKAHVGNPGNEIADMLANKAIDLKKISY